MAVDYKALKDDGFMRQAQKDRFSLRLKVVGGNLTSSQLQALSEISAKYGDGRVHLTSRQGVEIPFVKLEDIEAIRAALLEKGVETGACGARVRTVTACQGSAVCPSGLIDTYPLALEISERYFGKALPHKFKFGVTGCANNCLKAEENDLGIKGAYAVEWDEGQCTQCGACVKACRAKALSETESGIAIDRSKCVNCGRCAKTCPSGAWQGESAYIAYFGGTFGNRIAPGEKIAPMFRTKKELFAFADAALEFFSRHANAGERFRVCIDRVGWDVFREEMGGLTQTKSEA